MKKYIFIAMLSFALGAGGMYLLIHRQFSTNQKNNISETTTVAQKSIASNSASTDSIAIQKIEDAVKVFEDAQKKQDAAKVMALFSPPDNPLDRDGYEFLMGQDLWFSPRLYGTAGLGYKLSSYKIVSTTTTPDTATAVVQETRQIYDNTSGKYSNDIKSYLVAFVRKGDTLLIDSYYVQGGPQSKYGGF